MLPTGKSLANSGDRRVLRGLGLTRIYAQGLRHRTLTWRFSHPTPCPAEHRSLVGSGQVVLPLADRAHPTVAAAIQRVFSCPRSQLRVRSGLWKTGASLFADDVRRVSQQLSVADAIQIQIDDNCTGSSNCRWPNSEATRKHALTILAVRSIWSSEVRCPGLELANRP